MEFICIKCKQKYTRDDDEAYLCDICLEEKNLIAKDIDKKHSTIGQQPSGMATEMERIAREKGGYSEGVDNQGNTISRVFVNVRDIGLL